MKKTVAIPIMAGLLAVILLLSVGLFRAKGEREKLEGEVDRLEYVMELEVWERLVQQRWFYDEIALCLDDMAQVEARGAELKALLRGGEAFTWRDGSSPVLEAIPRGSSLEGFFPKLYQGLDWGELEFADLEQLSQDQLRELRDIFTALSEQLLDMTEAFSMEDMDEDVEGVYDLLEQANLMVGRKIEL